MGLHSRTVDRRRFLQSSLAVGATTGLAGIFPMRVAAATSLHRASVIDFGADPTGERDATDSVRKAIASLAMDNARLVFPAGRYRFAASDEVAMQFNGFKGIEVYANNAELLFAGNTIPFAFQSSKDVAVHDLKMDWDRPAFVQGLVKEASPRGFILDIHPDFPVNGHERFTGFAEFGSPNAAALPDAPSGSSAAGSLPFFPTGRQRRGGATVTLIAPQRLRVVFDGPGTDGPANLAALRAGMCVVLFNDAIDHSCFIIESCQGVLLDEVEVRQSQGTAFTVRGSRDFQLDGVTVGPRTSDAVQHLLAAGSGLHCSDCHGDIAIKDSRFEGIAGDAVNIYQSYWKIAERIDDRTVIVTGIGGRTLRKYEQPRSSDFVQLSRPADLQLLGEIGIEAVADHPDGAKLTFAETLSPIVVPGVLLSAVVDAPHISIDHTTIANTLGRGLLVHARAEITRSQFRGCVAEAILLAPDAERMQGPTVQTVRIRGNSFEGCNVAVATDSAKRGVITVDTAQTIPSASGIAFPLNSGVHIQSNTFLASPGAAIFVSSVDELVIDENLLNETTKAQGPAEHHAADAPVAIVLRNVANADVSNNISNVPQTIALTNCADTVDAQDNRLLTTSKLS